MDNKRLLGISAFNLLEIMLVLVIFIMLLAYAIPSWFQFHHEQMAQNAAAELARDLDWARSLSLQYENTVYIDFTGTGNATYTIYQSTAVPGAAGMTPPRPNYGTALDPFLSKDLIKSFGNITVSGISGNRITLSTNGAPASAVGVTVQYGTGTIQTTFTMQTTGLITFGSEGL